MNIFYLDHNPQVAAHYHCDKHVVKMILESAQLLSTAHRVLDGELINKQYVLKDYRETELYKATHVNHPCAIWVRQASHNYYWLQTLACFLCFEYTDRYKKVHATENLIIDALSLRPDNLPIGDLTPPAQAMPDQYKVPGDPVTAYRNYYINEKKEIAVWKYTEIPHWF